MIRQAEPQDLPAVLMLLAEANLPAEGVADHFGSFFVIDEATVMKWIRPQTPHDERKLASFPRHHRLSV